jgi:diguanylate cyclase (GGDEF)-like protein/putative nucleotidyltransferase with HDIG domain
MQHPPFTLARALWKPAGLILVLCSILVAYLFIQPGGQAPVTFVDNVLQGLFEAVGLLLALPVWLPKSAQVERSPASRAEVAHQRWVPRLLALALVCYVIGQALWTLNENILRLPALFPTWADAGYLGSYPFVLLAILLLPLRPLLTATRLRIVLDSLMIMAGLVTFSWYFILGPTILQGAGTLLGQLVSTAYPLATLVLMVCLLLLFARGNDPALRPAVFILALSLIIIVTTDSIYGYQELHNAYATGTLLDLGWPLGYMLVGLGARALQLSMRLGAPASGEVEVFERQAAHASQLPWRELLPYAFLPALGLLLLATRSVLDDAALKPGVYLGGAILIGLVLMRQLLAIRETNRMRQEVQHKNQALGAANARLEALATTDPLTELPNHGALSERLEQEVARARRYGYPLSLLFFDADHFKRVNDTYGHGAGDVVLQELGSRVRSLLRAGDTIGRYGGEEFLLLLPETALEQACEIAERLRKAIATYPLATSVVKEGIPTTLSLGVASFPDDGMTGSEVVEQADQAMYWAKRLGRNQVRTAREAARLRGDEALAATVSQLERSTEPTADGVSLEQVVRAKQLNTIQSLMWLLDLRDRSIFTHSSEVSDLAGAIARHLGESDAEVFAITTAALLHDLGKIALPDGLLYKAGPLTPAERTLIQQHPALGAQILEVSPFLHALMPAVAHHHENWDGSGYPDRLRGEGIPRAACIIRVAEAYQAMTTDRPYQRRRSVESARAELLRCAGTHFDPVVVQATLRVLTSEAPASPEGRPLPFPDVSGRPGVALDDATRREPAARP